MSDPVVDAETGITTAFTVSPVTRFAVNAPCVDVPVVVSVPADVPFTVRCVLPLASPVTVCVARLVDDALAAVAARRGACHGDRRRRRVRRTVKLRLRCAGGRRVLRDARDD